MPSPSPPEPAGRPCARLHPDPAASAGACRLCWLYEHDPAARALWGGPPPGGPSLLRRAANFTAAAAAHAAAGLREVPEAVYRKRLALCAENACGLYKDNYCLHSTCGCRLAGSVVAKLRWSEQKCPVGRWGPEE